MSLKAMLFGFAAPIEPTGAKFVYVVLCEHASDHNGEDWTCYPGINRICSYTSQKPRTVERHIAWLWSEGWLSRQRRKVRIRKKDAGVSVYEYVLHRDEDVRAALRAERAGHAPSITDAILAGVNDALYSRQNRQEPTPKTTDTPAILAGAYIAEPSKEPFIKPSATTAHGVRNPSRASGSAEAWAGVPPEIREQVVAIPQLGDSWARGWLDHCRWDADQRALVPRSTFAKSRIQQDLGAHLADLDLQVGEPRGCGQ